MPEFCAGSAVCEYLDACRRRSHAGRARRIEIFRSDQSLMPWTAVIPLKAEPLRKSRAFSPPSILHVGSRCPKNSYRHVAACIAQSGMFADAITLSPSSPPADVGTLVARRRRSNQCGVGAGREVTRLPDGHQCRSAAAPSLRPDCACCSCGERWVRSGGRPTRVGTNAVALLADVSFTFRSVPIASTPISARVPGTARVVDDGLAYDIDTVADIEAILHLACRLPPGVARS